MIVECFMTVDADELVIFRNGMVNPESDKWLEATSAEMQSITENHVWDLVELPPQCKTIGSK